VTYGLPTLFAPPAPGNEDVFLFESTDGKDLYWIAARTDGEAKEALRAGSVVPLRVRRVEDTDESFTLFPSPTIAWMKLRQGTLVHSPCILYSRKVDDDRIFQHAVVRLLSKEFEVETAFSEEVIGILASGRTFDVILSDVEMPILGGQALYEEVVRAHPRMRRVTFESAELTDGEFNTP
jgi:hypothetical protein